MARAPRPDVSGRRGQEARRRAIEELPARCIICARAIDTSLPGSHPDGATRDHVIPLSIGGDPDGPVGLAHRKCNTRRGARPLAEAQAQAQAYRLPDPHSRAWT